MSVFGIVRYSLILNSLCVKSVGRVFNLYARLGGAGGRCSPALNITKYLIQYPVPARKIRSVSEVDITLYLVRGYLNPQIRLIRDLQSSVQA